MNKKEISSELVQRYQRFSDLMEELGPAFEKAPQGKWTPGQQLEHLIKSVRPIELGMRLPFFVLKVIFGKANRPSRSYEILVQKYLDKVPVGYVPAKQYLPRAVSIKQKEKLEKQLASTVKRLADKVNGLSENQIDELVLPHPLLGKITLREMMYFTLYHVDHHYANVERDQQNLN